MYCGFSGFKTNNEPLSVDVDDVNEEKPDVSDLLESEADKQSSQADDTENQSVDTFACVFLLILLSRNM